MCMNERCIPSLRRRDRNFSVMRSSSFVSQTRFVIELHILYPHKSLSGRWQVGEGGETSMETFPSFTVSVECQIHPPLSIIPICGWPKCFTSAKSRIVWIRHIIPLCALVGVPPVHRHREVSMAFESRYGLAFLRRVLKEVVKGCSACGCDQPPLINLQSTMSKTFAVNQRKVGL